MYSAREYKAMIVVFSLSIIAAFIIEYLLYVVYARGVYGAFSPPTSYLFIPLVVIAFTVYRGLLVFVRSARWTASRILPVGIVLALVAFTLTLTEPFRPLAVYLIALVYYAELAVGVRLYRDVEPVSRLGAALFVGGMALFIILLPASIIDHRAALAPIVFNAVKTLGLAALLYSSYKAYAERRQRQAKQP